MTLAPLQGLAQGAAGQPGAQTPACGWHDTALCSKIAPGSLHPKLHPPGALAGCWSSGHAAEANLVFKQAARLGNVAACVAAAKALDQLHQRQDAMEYWGRAARAGHAPAMVSEPAKQGSFLERQIGFVLRPGSSVACCSSSLTLQQLQCLLTLLPAQILYGEAYYLGRWGLGQDAEEALRWLSRGAKALAPATAASLAAKRPPGAGRHWRTELLVAAEDESIPGDCCSAEFWV